MYPARQVSHVPVKSDGKTRSVGVALKGLQGCSASANLAGVLRSRDDYTSDDRLLKLSDSLLELGLDLRHELLVASQADLVLGSLVRPFRGKVIKPACLKLSSGPPH